MPHVVVSGYIPLTSLSLDFVPLTEEDSHWRIKIEALYTESKGKRVLLSAIVVEEGHVQRFFIRVSGYDSDDRFTIRLDPSTDPIKTKGVKRSIAIVAHWLMDRYSELKIEHHNLQDLLPLSV